MKNTFLIQAHFSHIQTKVSWSGEENETELEPEARIYLTNFLARRDSSRCRLSARDRVRRTLQNLLLGGGDWSQNLRQSTVAPIMGLGRLNYAAVARNVFQIEPLPGGALPVYLADDAPEEEE